MDPSIIAAPPDVHSPDVHSLVRKENSASPQPAVIEPPPAVAVLSIRQRGEINIGHTAVVAPAPQLPPPSLTASGLYDSGGRMVALNVRPSIGTPTELPEGNRRGSFAATPQGHSGASGAPAASSASGSTVTDTRGNRSDGKTGSGSNGTPGDLPSGLYVGKPDGSSASSTGVAAVSPVGKNPAPNSSVNPNLIASASPPPLRAGSAHALQPGEESKLSEAERQIFADRKFYSLTLNMPNLNSAGGSWVVRFAELKENANAGELSAPAATRKVDPAYPIELMRQNVAGTVTLYAVIHSDGKIGDVRVLRGIDDRLDQYASEALTRWQFQPAMKNGDPVAVEAVFQIPFRPARIKSGF